MVQTDCGKHLTSPLVRNVNFQSPEQKVSDPEEKDIHRVNMIVGMQTLKRNTILKPRQSIKAGSGGG